MSSFTKNIALTFSSRFLAAIFTSLSTILISRAFGPVGKGIFTMVAFFPTLALQFGHLGLGNANTYLISQDKEKTRKSFYNSFWYGLIIGWLFIVIFSLIYRYSPTSILGKGNIGNWAFYLSLLAIPFILWENFYQGIFVGRQEFKFFNLISLLSKILLFFGLVVLIFYFKVGLENLKYAIIYYVILMTLPAVIYSIYFLTQFGFPFEFDKLIFKKAIDFGLRSYVSCLLAFLVLRSDIYLINVFRGLYDVGLYSLAVSFSDGILLIVSSITLVLLPKITAEQNQSSEFTLRIARLVSVIMIFILFCSFIGARFVIKFLFGDSFLPSLLPFYILLPAIYFWSLSSILTQLFVSKGYPWFSVFIWLPGLVINVILNILFIPYYGIVVAAWTSLLAYFLNFLLHYFYFQKYRKTSLKEIIIPSFDEIRSFLRI